MSPEAPWRRCSGPGCPALGAFARTRGRCPACTRRSNRQRREGRSFDYSAAWWRSWRIWYISLLVAQGIVPVCGARLPGAPLTPVTACQEAGLMTGASEDGSGLHLHHEPELTEAEVTDRAAVCQPLRIVLTCRGCHSAITRARL